MNMRKLWHARNKVTWYDTTICDRLTQPSAWFEGAQEHKEISDTWLKERQPGMLKTWVDLKLLNKQSGKTPVFTNQIWPWEEVA